MAPYRELHRLHCEPSGYMADTRKRQRSPSPLASTVAVAADGAALVRRREEWEEMEGGSVLLLPPTTAVVEPLVHTRKGAGHDLIVKVGAFDMDDTLIKPASGGVFAKDDAADWEWVHPNVCGHLQHVHARGFLVVLFSNQMGIGKGSSWNAKKADAVMSKVVQLSSASGVPLCACVATRENAWRKPSPRMWTLLEERVNVCVRATCVDAAALSAVDCAAYSFYVGDAAGRSAANWAGRKRDFSCSDRQFAYNVQLPFFTPEHFFLTPAELLFQTDDLCSRRGTLPSWTQSSPSSSMRLSDAMLDLTRTSPASCEEFSWGDVSPAELQQLPRQYAELSVRVITPTAVSTAVLPAAPPFFARPTVQEMILFVGYPGCGKSSFFFRHLRPYGYHRVNRDTAQTRAKCLKEAEGLWAGGHSVVVDNTNPAAADRQGYIDIVQRVSLVMQKTDPAVGDGEGAVATPSLLPVRIFVFMHSRGLASHMNRVRAQVQGVSRVPTIAYSVYQSRLERPGTPAEVAALRIDSVWEVPAVACFVDAPARTEEIFFQLS
ncbi:hypothetical protein GH5_02575 [Leishmania sp. Ghana 2012 LV757]|uniref:hypothetical protein n=1 Tax=Leishmania sp. Ghana 2012 LV757 TaxID=2803181 RepID=UPI001B437BAA|nr:hypothetical protein GH5_02575 [Leishmania sp. Ghana 2012 LV757]